LAEDKVAFDAALETSESNGPIRMARFKGEAKNDNDKVT
jgi:hypothetical protein